ncbi:type II toxin-antitoxin system RelE/ParE family toxin [Desulfocurvus vexinensis]|uniref:type II toxin-antitoxin system RelE/ParE family toxin n=1 Tax=Desulfocurvus vexinensis TaxID=399548 RepID=UPI000A07512A|nr:type II toxin-antitoxin system RelE/ParE family toxin [Desulfocurvus vexinensis]
MSPRKALSIKWTASAWEDLDGITEYLLAQGVAFESVEAYVKRIFKGPEHLATLPGAGKPGRIPNTREWLVKNTPYALIYMVDEDNVYILRVMHSSRRFPECTERVFT